MAQQTTFMTLPPELRERVYSYISTSHSTRRVQTPNDNNNNGTSTHKLATSAITATCRLIHAEYENVARKMTTALEFTTIDMHVHPIVNFFLHHMDAEYLAVLQLNRATINVKMLVPNPRPDIFEIDEFYAWALFLIAVGLDAVYVADDATWLDILEVDKRDLEERCVVEKDTARVVRDKMGDIRDQAKVFDRESWRAYARVNKELQVRRHREWDRRVAERAERAARGLLDSDDE